MVSLAIAVLGAIAEDYTPEADTMSSANAASATPTVEGKEPAKKMNKRGKHLRPMTNKSIRSTDKLPRPAVEEINVFACMNNINDNLPYCHGVMSYSYRSAFGNVPSRQELSKYEIMLRLVALLRARDEILESADALDGEVDVSALDAVLFPVIWEFEQACGNAEERVKGRRNGQTLQIELLEQDVQIGHFVAVLTKEAWEVVDGEGSRVDLLEAFSANDALAVCQPVVGLKVRYREGATGAKQ